MNSKVNLHNYICVSLFINALVSFLFAFKQVSISNSFNGLGMERYSGSYINQKPHSIPLKIHSIKIVTHSFAQSTLELENSIDWHLYCLNVTSFHSIDLDWKSFELLDWQMILLESIVLLFVRIGSTTLWSQD